MGCQAIQWLVVSVSVAVTRGCNVRELSDIIQRRFREEVAAQCSSIGDKCSFDRECCKGLECAMSASQSGVGLSCQRAVLADPDRADMALEAAYSQEPREPKSDGGDWMLVRSVEDRYEEGHRDISEDKSVKMYPTDMLTEIANLQEKKKLKLLRENDELEKLFTEREEKELEQLRALREDAEADELRRLKELRLRRKMRLIQELKELRGLKAEEDLKAIEEFKKQNANYSEKGSSINLTNPPEYSSDNSTLNVKTPLKTTLEPTESVSKHKQGIVAHHKRKHHHHKKKDQHQSLNLTNGTPEGEENTTEYNAG